jgi:hypothetical protein
MIAEGETTKTRQLLKLIDEIVGVGAGDERMRALDAPTDAIKMSANFFCSAKRLLEVQRRKKRKVMRPLSYSRPKKNKSEKQKMQLTSSSTKWRSKCTANKFIFLFKMQKSCCDSL